jgi:dihydrofolate reductase
MELTATTFITLDGVMQGPGGPDEDRAGGFEHGGWAVPFFDEDVGRVISDIFTRTEAVLFGRTTYDMMAAYWPQVTDPGDVVARKLNTVPKHVVTSRPQTLASWTAVEPIEGDVVARVRALKQRAGGELQVHGSHQLLQTLLRERLVDELHVLCFPVVVGAGKRLFADDAPAMSLRAEHSEMSRSGVVYTRYVPGGDITRQSFVVEDGKEVVRPG